MKYGSNIGLKFYGTFTFGGQGSTDDCDKKTITLLNELIDDGSLWRFQLSISTPQPGTPFYDWAKSNGYLKEMDWKRFDGGNCCVVNLPGYSSEQVLANFNEAQKAYEKSFNRRYSITAKDTFHSLKITQPAEVLLFRSTRMKQMNHVVDALRHSFNQSKITVLAQPTVEQEFKQNPKVDEVLMYGDTHFNTSTFPSRLLEDLAKRAFPLGVIPYNNISGNGYSEIKALAQQMGIKKLVAVNIEGKIFDLDNPGDFGRSHLR